MAMHVDCFNRVVDSPKERIQYDKAFSAMIDRLGGYSHRDIPFGELVEKLLAMTYVNRQEPRVS